MSLPVEIVIGVHAKHCSYYDGVTDNEKFSCIIFNVAHFIYVIFITIVLIYS